MNRWCLILGCLFACLAADAQNSPLNYNVELRKTALGRLDSEQKRITHIPNYSRIGELLAAVSLPIGTTASVIDSAGATLLLSSMPLRESMHLQIRSAWGEQIDYTLDLTKALIICSELGVLDHENLRLAELDPQTTSAELVRQIYPVWGGKLQLVYKETGQVVALDSSLLSDKIFMEAFDAVDTLRYSLAFRSKLNQTTILATTIGQMDSKAKYLTIPASIPVFLLLSALTISPYASVQCVDHNGHHLELADNLTANDKLIIVAENGESREFSLRITAAKLPVETLVNEQLETKSIAGKVMILEGDSGLRITGGPEALAGAIIHLNSPDAYVFLTHISPRQVREGLRHHFQFEGEAMRLFDAKIARLEAVHTTDEVSSNAMLRQYYTFGTAVNPYRHHEHPAALLAWSDQEETKGKTNFGLGYHRGGHASLQDGNKLRAFTLKRGYMATLAVAKRTNKQVGEANSYDAGKVPFWEISHSKVFVAVEENLSVMLADDLAGKVNFISVQPWRWVSKKGNCTHNQQVSEMQGDWSYNWGLGSDIEQQPEYSPMMFGKGRIARNDLWEVFTGMGDNYRASLTHLMGFNEPDHKGQSNMTVADAIAAWPRFLETGARLVSPSVTQGGHRHWLTNFHQQCNDSAYRVDAMGIHWYDWGAWRKGQDPDADPVAIFERFKRYLETRYQAYQRPLWITEFNANKNRNHWVHEAFLKLALPYLDSLPYVERYAYFEPFGGKGDFFDADGRLTPVGKVYRNHQSVPSVRDILEETEMDIK